MYAFYLYGLQHTTHHIALVVVMDNRNGNGTQRLWYGEPADGWTEALPVGNGRLGGMVFGGTSEDVIALNEETLWSGHAKDQTNPGAFAGLLLARELIDAGCYAEAQAEIETNMLGPFTQAYQPLGKLRIHTDLAAPVDAYERSLELDRGVAEVRFRSGNISWRRSYFSSAPDRVLVVRYESDRPGSITCAVSLESPLRSEVAAQAPDRLLLRGECPWNIDVGDVYTFENKNTITYGEDGNSGLRFTCALQVVAPGGTVTAEGTSLRVAGADSLTILLGAGSDYEGRPLDRAEREVTKAAEKKIELLLADHESDFASLFGRVDFFLGKEGSGPVEEDAVPTDVRLERMRAGAGDNGLLVLLFQYGRYLLVSSSRPGSLPANLQGIWNEHLVPPWWSNWTMNINLQMNYWLAEPCNLAECHEPLFAFLDRLQTKGKNTARIHYGCSGWVAHHMTDIWLQTGPCGFVDERIRDSASWGFWPLSGAWLCRHLWEHYRFGLDREFLGKTAYPIMRGAALFLLDWLVPDADGKAATNPSTSPENSFLYGDGKRSAVSKSATMDISIIRDLFTSCVDAAAILQTDQDLSREIQKKLEQLPPVPVNPDGRIGEWSEDFTESEAGHRHFSHLFALFPGDGIACTRTPLLAGAAKKSIQHRMRNGGGHTGWSNAWLICLWARLGEGEEAYRSLLHFARTFLFSNLFDFHPPAHFQIDGNLGFTTAVTELLLQSGDDGIHLLPALPAAWPSGRITGLRARGAFTVSIHWDSGRLRHAEIVSARDAPCTIRYGKPLTVSCDGIVLSAAVGDGCTAFASEAGKTYRIEVAR